ncbi:unnamed protein product, partial [marine sediment metagenome]
MIIEPGSKRLEELVTEFWSMRLRYSFAPPKVKIYSREEYIEETGNDKAVARYSAEKEQISVLPDIVLYIKPLVHELAHHLQSNQLGSAEFLRRYDKYNEEFGYQNNPYEVEAREFEMKWWSEFEQFLKKKLEVSATLTVILSARRLGA